MRPHSRGRAPQLHQRPFGLAQPAARRQPDRRRGVVRRPMRSRQLRCPPWKVRGVPSDAGGMRPPQRALHRADCAVLRRGTPVRPLPPAGRGDRLQPFSYRSQHHATHRSTHVEARGRGAAAHAAGGAPGPRWPSPKLPCERDAPLCVIKGPRIESVPYRQATIKDQPGMHEALTCAPREQGSCVCRCAANPWLRDVRGASGVARRNR